MAPDSLPSFHFLSDVEGAELRKAYEDAGQSQVFQYVDTRKCTESETAELIAQLRSIDLPRLVLYVLMVFFLKEMALCVCKNISTFVVVV